MILKKILLSLIILSQLSIFSQDNKVLVSNISEYKAAIKKAIPGTKIILKNGIWKDAKLDAFGNGTKEKPITIQAETAGKVILSGNSSIDIYGTYIIVSGFWFKEGNPTEKSIVNFKKNDTQFANNCRFTHNTISYYNPEDASVNSHWVDLWGKNNRVDHNNFTGKTNDGTTVVVWLKGEEHIENNHSIDHNFFGPRPDLGKNGGETIRIGTSENSMKSSKTIVENNTFKNCDGEIEIISNKSGDNIFRDNLFIESKGALTLRHGDNALVENNIFIGNNVSNTGGIRIINQGHIIRNNLMIGLTGNNFRGPIVVMNGVPNSPLNRYRQVKNVNIQNNTLINCGSIEFAAGKDDERSLPPTNTIFANNLITNTNGIKILNSSDDISGITLKNNIVDSSVDVDENQFTKQTIDWNLLQSLPMPSSKNQFLISNFKNDKSPKVDITESEKNPFVVGAFNLDNAKLPKALKVKTGPYWNPIIETPKVIVKAVTIEVEPGVETLAKALKKATPLTTLQLKDGLYYFDKTQKIKSNITIKGTKETVLKVSDNLEKELTYFFRVEENATLNLKNITFDGSNDTQVKYAIVSPDKEQGGLYKLFIDGCTFKNFTNKNGGSIYKAYNGTLADTISIKNSSFLNSYRGLNLSYEKENFKYNAKTIIIHNSIFKDIEEFAINYTKVDPLLLEQNGSLHITNSIFSRVSNSEKGYVIKVKSIPSVIIKNSVFENSYNIINPIKLSDKGSIIENCLVYSCGKIIAKKNAEEKNILYKNPKWDDKNNFIPSKKSDLLKENNKIETIGLIFSDK
ncbi:poly(beta-D-mannuronate) lyase [Polaribacter sp. KT25b]|uniref:chondroitinase-B domain-containing protein n=1 Tax=Polaribacter sp. KT25b TaxID=1855336 RepID=UPI00087CD368|nr:chondroitinase-B domain-containing protein [Polaribacter sp. KT25b]SDS03320.1 poly(beta-D-mannuronate) lyase [Polaribacter sp. KT25b]